MISVIGGEAASPDALDIAEKVGREIARRGATLVCGGRGGIMEAACRGAREAGGHTIGIMPGRNHEESPPNGYVEFPVFTGMGFTRNAIVVLSGDAVIAIDGSYGTLSELAFALIHDAPIVGIDTWDFNYHGFASQERIIRLTDPAEAVAKTIELAKARLATE